MGSDGRWFFPEDKVLLMLLATRAPWVIPPDAWRGREHTRQGKSLPLGSLRGHVLMQDQAVLAEVPCLLIAEVYGYEGLPFGYRLSLGDDKGGIRVHYYMPYQSDEELHQGLDLGIFRGEVHQGVDDPLTGRMACPSNMDSALLSGGNEGVWSPVVRHQGLDRLPEELSPFRQRFRSHGLEHRDSSPLLRSGGDVAGDSFAPPLNLDVSHCH